jgi:hypothetical protein
MSSSASKAEPSREITEKFQILRDLISGNSTMTPSSGAVEGSTTDEGTPGRGAGAGAAAGSTADHFSGSGSHIPTWEDPSGKAFRMEKINGNSVFLVVRSNDQPDNITPIAIEMYFYTMRLINAMFDETIDPNLKETLISKIFSKIHQKIKNDYTTGIIKTHGLTREHPDFPAIINAHFDEQRPIYAKFIQKNLVTEASNLNTTVKLRKKWEKHLTEHTAGKITIAWQNQDNSTEIIEMCEQSSHSKKHASPAIVPIKLCSLDGREVSTHFRCPSLVDTYEPLIHQIQNLMNLHDTLPSRVAMREAMRVALNPEIHRAAERAKEIAVKAKEKISPAFLTGSKHKLYSELLKDREVQEAYKAKAKLEAELEAKLNSPRVMIYNLLTSFPPLIDPDDQASTAMKIFTAAHEYNKLNGNLFLPMNLPINQQSIDLRFTDKRTSEALFLSHLAVASSTLKEISEILKDTAHGDTAIAVLEKIKNIKALYQEFLASGFREISQWPERAKLLEDFKFIQTAIPGLIMGISNGPLATPKQKLQAALLKIFYEKYMPNIGSRASDTDAIYADDQKIYGAVVQALHLATSDGSVTGCKSANDRFGLVWNIVEALRNPTPALTESLNDFIAGRISPENFSTAVYAHTNQEHCYGPGHIPSIADVGAPKYRVSAADGDLLRNDGFLNLANVPAIFTNLKASQSEKIQGHKPKALKLLRKTRAALEEICSRSPSHSTHSSPDPERHETAALFLSLHENSPRRENSVDSSETIGEPALPPGVSPPGPPATTPEASPPESPPTTPEA